MNKTIVIWDTVDACIKFFVVEEDLSHLNNAYLNSMDISNEDTDTIVNLVYDDNGHVKVNLLDEFPVSEVTSNTKVIVGGFIP